METVPLAIDAAFGGAIAGAYAPCAHKHFSNCLNDIRPIARGNMTLASPLLRFDISLNNILDLQNRLVCEQSRLQFV